MKTANTKRGLHKKVSAGVAALAVFALLLTGTFAWFSGKINVENVFTNPNETELPTVVLRDDFCAPNKDVYAENLGTDTVYVRIRLNEFLILGQSSRPVGTIPDADWKTHEPKWETHGTEQALNHEINNYNANFKWIWGSRVDESGNLVYATKEYIKGDISLAQSVYFNTSGDAAYAAAIAAAKVADPASVGTTVPGDVISIDWYLKDGFAAQYNQSRGASITDRTQYVGWLYDEDGWAYWSQPLKAGEATSLLLDRVDTVGMGDDEYCYIIDVIMEAVDKADLEAMWIAGGVSVNPDKYAQSAQADDLGIEALGYIKDIA